MITMYDSVDIGQIPAGAQAAAGYVNGRFANVAELRDRFPHARILSIAVTADADADCLDIETGDATPAGAPGWHERQKARGTARPCLYASASVMESGVLPALAAAEIPRGAVRLWSAHYGAGEHICGPASCKLMSTAADGTQWTDKALGRNLDQSLLAADFFAVPAPPAKPATVPSMHAVTVQLPELSRGADDARLPHWWVRRAQLLLTSIFHIPLTADGVFGPATEAAIVRLQDGAGLPKTGKLDPATWALILAGVKP